MSHNVAQTFAAMAKEQPNTTALIFPGKAKGTWDQWTYAELAQKADAYARGFAKAGMRRGDRTLFLVRPSLEFYALMLGLLQLGAIPVVVDPGMGLKNVMKCIAQIAPRAMVAIPPVHVVKMFAWSTFKSVEVSITHGTKFLWGGTTTAICAQGGDPLPEHTFAAEDEGFIVFTSGSTGVPKGVSFRHGMFSAATTLCEKELDFKRGGVSLETFAPFVLLHLAAGETVVVPRMDMSKPVEAKGEDLLEAFVAHRPAIAFASPIVMRKVMDECIRTNTKIDSVKLVITGVAPIPGDLHRGLVPFLAPGGRIAVNYGATESLMASAISSPEIVNETWPLTAKGHGNCVGKPYGGIDVRIIKISDDAIPKWSEDLRVPAGELGEIVVGGPITSPEYKDLPDANAKSKVMDGDRLLHRMGDLGYLDDTGRIWFCGRKAHRIETGGRVIPNVPVEGVFNEDPAVFRSALVGVGPKGNETSVLCVELKKGATLDERALLARAQGTKWEGVVQKVLVHPGFPMDARHNSKIRNEDLKVWAAGQLPGIVRA